MLFKLLSMSLGSGFCNPKIRNFHLDKPSKSVSFYQALLSYYACPLNLQTALLEWFAVACIRVVLYILSAVNETGAPRVHGLKVCVNNYYC